MPAEQLGQALERQERQEGGEAHGKAGGERESMCCLCSLVRKHSRMPCRQDSQDRQVVGEACAMQGGAAGSRQQSRRQESRRQESKHKEAATTRAK